MRLLKILFIAFLAVALYEPAMAQEKSTAGSITRTRVADSKNKNDKAANPSVSNRAQAFYEHTPVSESDLTWMRVIYRSLDLTKEKNMALYFPEEPTEEGENLFRIIMRLLANNQVAAYEYLDGREIFTDKYKVNVKDVLDRFHILYTEAKGSTPKNPRYEIDEADVPSSEVLSYYILERWEFDRISNSMRQRVEAICPVLHRSGDFGGDVVKYPMFWIKFDALRPTLTQQYVFVDNDNNLASYNYDDYFNLGLYDGEIYKTRNLRNQSMIQMYPDPDDRKRAQDSIENRLRTYDKNLWVPSREELMAAREAREALSGEGEAVASRDSSVVTEKAKTVRSSRGSKKSESKAKVKSPKAPKVKKASSPSSAGRSVRRHR